MIDTLINKSNPFTVLYLGNWIDLDTNPCYPECRNAQAKAAIASRSLTSAEKLSQRGFSTYSRQLESSHLQTSLKPQLVGSAKSHLTERKLGSSERKQEYKRSELDSLLAGTSRNRHLTSPWVKSKVHTGDPVMGKLTPGGHSSRTAGVNTEVDTELDVVINNIQVPMPASKPTGTRPKRSVLPAPTKQPEDFAYPDEAFSSYEEFVNYIRAVELKWDPRDPKMGPKSEERDPGDPKMGPKNHGDHGNHGDPKVGTQCLRSFFGAPA